MSMTIPLLSRRLGDEGRVDHEGRAVQRLRGPENRALERMSDHDVVANFDGEQGSSLRIDDGLAEYAASGVENSRQSLRQIAKRNRRCQQCVEPWIAEQCDGGRETAAVRPARTVRWRDASDLARYQPKPAAVERSRQALRSLPRHHTSSFRARLPRLRPVRAPSVVHRASRWRERRGRSRPLRFRAQRN